MSSDSAVGGSCDLNRNKASGAGKGGLGSRDAKVTLEQAYCPDCGREVVGKYSDSGELICPRCGKTLTKAPGGCKKPDS